MQKYLRFSAILVIMAACSSNTFSGKGNTQKSLATPKSSPSSGENGSPKGSGEVSSMSCKVEAEDSIKAGASVTLKISVNGEPDTVLVNGVPLAEKGSQIEHTLSPDSDQTFVVELRKGDQTTSCEFKVAVIQPDEVLREDQALCFGQKAKGRKILMFVAYTPMAADVDIDAQEIEAATGLTIDRFSADQVTNAEAALQGTQYDAIWVFSDGGGESRDETVLFQEIKAQVEKGAGLVLYGDNAPYYYEANALLNLIHPDWNIALDGNYFGEGQVSKDGFPSTGKGKLLDHPVTAGLYQSVSEGTSISNLVSTGMPSVMDQTQFAKVLINSEGNVSVAAIDGSPFGKKTSRTIIHGGFTSFYRGGWDWAWDSTVSPGTPQFIFNIACWTAGVL
ncbi:MAG: hypothetical protein AB7T49_11925 [Oligoflexales bacterium]